MAKANPGVLGAWSALDQAPSLWWEFQTYAAAEAREAQRRTARGPRVAGRHH